ncbi:MAG: cell envelope integrity protein CreD [Ferruginibacter sp.]
MKKIISTAGLSAGLWLFTAAIFAAGMMIVALFNGRGTDAFTIGFLGFLASLAGSVPAFVCLLVMLPFIRPGKSTTGVKIFYLLLLMLFTCMGYGLLAGIFRLGVLPYEYVFINAFVTDLLAVTGLLFICSFTAVIIKLQALAKYFSHGLLGNGSFTSTVQQLFTNINSTVMEQPATQAYRPAAPSSSQPSNRILIKGLITGALILIMLVPTIFITELVKERQLRQKEVVAEVSSKWSNAQTLSGPFLTVPYTDTFINSEGKTVAAKKQLILLAEKSELSGNIIPEERPRSIYKVLLYRTALNFSGNFKARWPADIHMANIDFANAKLCFSLSDFKGIEEELKINFNGQDLALTPGLPVNDLGGTGLSVPVGINSEMLAGTISFKMQLKLKGSERLHFIPMAAGSKYSLRSTWPNPSFDGNSLPAERNISDSGFSSSWSFNQANLPYATVVRSGDLKAEAMAFGVSLVQPAGQYDKTLRSVKYAILFIGLSFALFFIIELMQKRPFHPVQYVLVGLALVIFYTLLLSISEYILFDQAYLIAAVATILLVTFYAKSHFRSWKTAAVFAAVLSMLYGFIFILIRLEDTALLVGSIGLFAVLALVMFASRKINWYGNNNDQPGIAGQ